MFVTAAPVPAPLYVAPRRDLAVVYRRRRFVALLVLTVLVVALVLAVRTVAATLGGVPASAPEGNITGPRSDPPARVVVVQPGDTVWTIARSVQPDGDVRPLVDALVASHPGPLRPGDELTVPTAG